MQERILKILSSNAIQISSDSLSRALFADEWRDTSKEIADTFKRFVKYCMEKDETDSREETYKLLGQDDDDQVMFFTLDELFEYWSEVIDQKEN